jgi:hypothetical protein
MLTRTRRPRCRGQRHAPKAAGTLAAAAGLDGKGGSPVGPGAYYPNGNPDADCDGGCTGLTGTTSPASARPLSFADGREAS